MLKTIDESDRDAAPGMLLEGKEHFFAGLGSDSEWSKVGVGKEGEGTMIGTLCWEQCLVKIEKYWEVENLF